MVTPAQRDAIVGPIREGLGELIGGNPGIFQDRPGFIRGGGSDNPFADVVREVARFNCRQWGRADKSNYSVRVNQGNAALCYPYLEDIGELPPEGSVAPPFLGGQCGIPYRLNGKIIYDLTNCSNGGFFPDQEAVVVTEYSFVGPITSITGETFGTVSCGQNQATLRVVFDGGAQNNTAGLVFNPVNALSNVRFQGVVEPQPGAVDNCGNPPGEYKPPGSSPGAPIPPSITVDVPGVGPVTVDVEPDPVGDPIICFEEIDVCITVPVGGDDDGGGGGGGGGAPTTPGEPGDGGDSGAGGEQEGEAGDGQELTGVLVEVLTAPPNANKLDNVSAVIYRGVGYVAMGYPGLLGVDTSAAVVQSPQFFHAQQRGLTAWRVRANVGFNLRTTPYYRETES